MRHSTSQSLRFAVDMGGTFTDLLIEGVDERLRLYKRPTTPGEPIRGLLDVIDAAAADLGTTRAELLARAEVLINGTTRATNAIVEGKTALTAFVTTRGHRDILLVREGGGRHWPMDYSQPYPDPYIPRSLSFEVPERIYADGRVVTPLDEQASVAIIENLRAAEVEAVAVCFLWSIVNPEHELQFGQLLDRHLPDVPYTLSHQLNPSVREYRRACSAAMDASLKPLMGPYVKQLGEQLRVEGFGGRLLMLTSGGGMLDAQEVWNKPIHTIGCGPAAAPVAGRHFARADAGSDLAIVTDAGGTTYDVSLVQGGKIPWTRETMVGDQKSGFMTGFPSVDVRSIGAGGGSIAWVDEGGLLHVGPESAGSDPGPACWMRGGKEATVTDACVVLGYLDSEYYLGGSMPIERAAAERVIRTKVAEPLGLNLEQAASAIFDLACQNMMVAIEEITLERGISASEAILIGGGGGGGLYSAAIASKLGTRMLVIPSASAALSACGALLSEIKRDFSTTRMMLTAVFDPQAANEIISDLRQKCVAFAEGAEAREFAVSLSVEARYPDQVWEIEVPLPVERFESEADVRLFVDAFHRVHLELFAIEDRASAVEIITWRAAVTCPLRGDHGVAATHFAKTEAKPNSQRRSYFSQCGWVDAHVMTIEEWRAGQPVTGPAFIESPVTTIIVPPGAKAQRNEAGSVLLEPGGSKLGELARRAIQSDTSMSGYELALINSRLESVVLAMRNTLLRTSRSAIMNMARDFACGILTADDEILSVCEGLPCMTLRGPDLQARYMKDTHPVLLKGDAFVHNSPYHGNTHPADWTVLMPVVDSKGRHRATVYAKAHMADCGNSVPTTFFAGARDVYEEGALIFPCVKVQRTYELDDDFVRQCRLRIRVPDMWFGDFLAMLGAVRVGEARLLEFLDSVPEGTFSAFARDWMDYSERRMIAAVEDLPSGRTRVTLQHDPVPGAPEGLPVNVDLEVRSQEARVRIDLTDNLDCQPFGMNLSESTVSSAVMAGVFSSIRKQVPLNSGSFRRIDVVLRENCVIGIPKHPFSCSVATTNLSELAGKAVAMGFAQLADGFGLAEVGRHMPPAMAVISGIDPRHGRGPFQNFLCLLVCNGPGAPDADGWLTTIGIGVAGLQHHDSIEVDEMKYPILVTAQYLLTDTEGAGRHTGSPAAYVAYEPVDTNIEVMFTSDGTVNPPLGVRGGLDGAPARQFLRKKDGTLQSLDICTHVTVEPGESIISVCTGAGGYGSPYERSPHLVAKDVREGLVTVERARQVYGVALAPDFSVDLNATVVLRAAAA